LRVRSSLAVLGFENECGPEALSLFLEGGRKKRSRRTESSTFYRGRGEEKGRELQKPCEEKDVPLHVLLQGKEKNPIPKGGFLNRLFGKKRG